MPHVISLQSRFLVAASMGSSSLPSVPLVGENFHGIDTRTASRSAILDSIKLCGKQKDVCKGARIHAYVRERALFRTDVRIGTALISMYGRCGACGKAREVFDELPMRDVVSWTALITAYVQNGLGKEAFNCFARMRDDGFLPNAVTYTSLLKGCSVLGSVERGQEIHHEISKQGLLETDFVLGSALVDMYVKCGALAKARDVFEELPVRNVVTWTALITGYAQHGFVHEALASFNEMKDEGLSPNIITYASVLKACGILQSVEKGEAMHAEIRKQGLLDRSIMLANALIDMYAKCGAVVKAQEVFDTVEARDVITWTALIAGYALDGLADETLSCFARMQEEGIFPDPVTFSSILKICGSFGSIGKGEELHAKMSENLWKTDIMLGTALMDMYVKCGALAKAEKVFIELPRRDSVSWNALIAGYAQLGEVKTVSGAFHKMEEDGFEPNDVTFILVLTACSHGGLVEEGQTYFQEMRTRYCVNPTLEHYACMVDLFSRAGHFDRALNLIEKVPPSNRLQLWLTLLAACRQWVNLELGVWSFQNLEQLDRENGAAYVCVSNIYAGVNSEDLSVNVETVRKINEHIESWLNV